MKKRQKVVGFMGIQTGLDPCDVTMYEINLDPQERKRKTERERERERERRLEGERAGTVVACLCVR